jgi:hypothetical protein
MAAFAAAHSLPVVRLDDALELVLLGATKVDKDRYERLAVRWLTRLLEERRISLHEHRTFRFSELVSRAARTGA